MPIAHGLFDVKLLPLPSDAAREGIAFGRLSLDKQFHPGHDGGLEATGKGEMLSALTGMQGSAGYVAIEFVTGTLAGRTGTFALQHSGTMDRGAATLSVTVVPDSGTDGLTGLTGRMHIIVEGGKHLYEFEYQFADTAV